MSFGFSIGDFIAAFELANRIRKEFVGAPKQFKDVSDEYVLQPRDLPSLTSDLTESEASPLSSEMSMLAFPNASSTASRRKT